jgi:pilus assembly protein CpaF
MTAESHVVELYSSTIKQLLMPISRHMEDEGVSEVMINGYNEIFVERGGKLEKTDSSFEDEEALAAAMRNVAQYVGKRLTKDDPSIEARLPDGSRVHIVQAPAARKGICVAIRKFSKHKLDMDALIGFGALTPEVAEFLGICVAAAKNIIVSGGTGSGKTTLLNCLSAMIMDGERIIVLEDSSELQLQQEHVVPFEAQPPDRNGRGGLTIRDLFRASLRMRPDRVVVGECRGGEALDMIQAMTSGHSGSLSTCHANTPYDGLNRLETMALMGDVPMPLTALRKQLASAVDVIVQISRFHDGARKITEVAEVLPLSEAGEYQLRTIFRLQSDSATQLSKASLQYTGNQPTFSGDPYDVGIVDKIKLSAKCWQEPK